MKKKAKKPAAKIEGKEVNKNELAKIFGVSLPTITQWNRNNIPVHT